MKCNSHSFRMEDLVFTFGRIRNANLLDLKSIHKGRCKIAISEIFILHEL